MIDRMTATVPAIAAHRGWHADGAPENSLAALERAILGGADWVETDLRQLGDGTIVAHHDAHLHDGTPLSSMNRSMLADHPEIPTLEDFSRRIGSSRVGALVEFKEHGYEERAYNMLKQHVPSAQLNLMSFDPASVRALRALAPDQPVGLLSDRPPVVDGVRQLWNPASLVADAKAAGASFLGLNVGQASEPTLAAADHAGMGVAVWTVDDAKDLTYLLGDRRVGMVITDVPSAAQNLRDQVAGTGAKAGVRLLRAAATMR